MSRRKWTLMLVPHDEQRVRAVQITSTAIRATLSLLALAVLLSGALTVALIIKQSHEFRANRLAKQNALLAAEVEQMRGQMRGLEQSLDALSEQSETFRTLSGLDALSGDLQGDSIGDAVQSTLESSELYREEPSLGRKVFEAARDIATLSRRAKLLSVSMDETLHSFAANSDRLAATPSIAPASGYLSSLFAVRRHPVLKITRPHKGIDIAAPVGAPILAPARGTVRFAGRKAGGYGNVVELEHGYGYRTRFAHASRILVKAGQKVERGDTIAEVGATGLVSGPHLHYEVEVEGRQVNPLDFIGEGKIPH
jgi:murein DD-endopeptidase MepM/ murein hydrolase activator NlpD